MRLFNRLCFTVFTSPFFLLGWLAFNVVCGLCLGWFYGREMAEEMWSNESKGEKP